MRLVFLFFCFVHLSVLLLPTCIIVIFCTPVKVSLSFTMCFLQAIRRLRQAPLVSQPFPFLWAEPCHTGVSLSCVAGHGRTTFPTVAPRSLHESLSPDWKSHGVQFLMAHCKHKRICLHYSVVKELLGSCQPVSIHFYKWTDTE